MPLQTLDAQTVAVCGGGYTGQAIVRTLRRLGKQCVVTDSRAADHETIEAARRVLADLDTDIHADGHDPDILRRADLVVVSPGVPLRTLPVDALRDAGVPVWSELELASRLTHAKLIGITGTKGKSTCSAVVSRMLDAPLTNSEAFSARGVPLIELVAECPDVPRVVVEISSFQLEGIDQLRPWVATLLNIAEDHIKDHGSLASYIAAKQRIFENQTATDRAVYNADDPRSLAAAADIAATRVPFSASGSGALASGVWATGSGVQVALPESLGGLTGELMAWADVSGPLRLQRPSLLGAVATSLAAEADLDQVRRVAAGFEGLSHRMEVIREWSGLTFVNDSKATNPYATANAIRQSPAPVVLIAGGQTKGIDLSPLTDVLAEPRAVVLIGEDAELLAKVAREAGQDTILFADSLRVAVEEAVRQAHRGDWVILSPCGASFDMFRNFEDRGEQFRALVLGL